MQKIGLFLMTEKGYRSLLAVCENNLHHHLSFVCIGRDKAVINDFSLELANLCNKYNIKNYYKSATDTNQYTDSSYNIAISWRWLLKCENLIVFHDSLLPKYRGFAPLVNSLINGEKELGVTALRASEEYDKGNIIVQKKITIKYPILIKEAIKLISPLYQEILIDIIQKIVSGNKLSGYKQNEADATYSLWLNDEDYFIDWNLSSEKIKRKIDACGFPFLFAKSYVSNRIIQIEDCQIVEDVIIENRTSGKVIFINDNYPVIVCGIGLLMIKSAHFTDNNESFLPLKNFRIRLTNDTI